MRKPSFPQLSLPPLPSLPPPPRWTQPLLRTFNILPNPAISEPRWLTLAKLSLTLCIAASLVALTMPRDVEVQRTWRRWVQRSWRRLLFALTVINPCFSVAADNYTFLRDASSSLVLTTKREVPSEAEEKLRRLVLGVGAIRPRRVFAAGATLRGLQMHTPLRRAFDPGAHFGATINLLALADGIAWPASFTLGYAASEWWWRLGDPEEAARHAPRRAVTAGDEAAAGAVADETTANRVDEAMALHRRGSRAPLPWWRRGGFRIQLHIPSLHLSGMLLTLLIATHRWRWVVVWAVAATGWHAGEDFLWTGA